MDWSRWAGSAADLVLGSVCLGCGRPGWAVCGPCRDTLTRPPGSFTRPDPCPPGFPVTAAAGPYDPVVQHLISAHKERQGLALTPLLGDRLAVSLGHLLSATGWTEPVVVVPVPSRAAVVRERGFDATTALARRAAATVRHPGSVRVRRMLAPTRRMRDQAGLSADERQVNLAGGFRAVAARGDRAVVVVDDVVTTGASLTEAVRALAAAGVPVLGAATVAATVRTGHR